MNHLWIVILVYEKASNPGIHSVFYFIELAKDEVEILSKTLVTAGKRFGKIQIIQQSIEKIPFEVVDRFHSQMLAERK